MSKKTVAPVTGVILAGGQSLRFGRDKAVVRVGGVRMIDRVEQVLAQVAAPIHISLWREDTINPLPARKMILDEPRGVGPLGALAAALAESPHPWCLFVACDMPFLEPEGLSALLRHRSEDTEAVVAMDSDGRLHPLCACLHKSLAPAILASIAEGELSVQRMIRKSRFCQVEIPDKMLTNVNRPDELSALGN